MITTRRSFVAGGGALALTLSARIAPGAVPETQVTGVQHFRMGSGVLSALLDGHLELGAEMFEAISDEQAAELLTRAFRAPGPVSAPVNAYVWRDGTRSVLIDAGGGGVEAFPTLGRLEEAMAEADVSAEEVDTVLLTHLHPDHIGGLVRGGEPVFPNAELRAHQAEIAYWSSAQNRDGAPERMRGFFDLARTMIDAYGNRLRPFSGEEDVAEGFRAVPLPGHTPGHTGYRIGAAEEATLVWGDIVHAGAFQFPRPGATIAFDVDPEQAAETRRQLLARAAEERLRIVGMHLDFPGIGHVARDEGEAYYFEPAPFPYSLERDGG